MIEKIRIEKIVYPGKALGRGEDGIATFVEGALPDEVVEVDILKKKRTFKEAKLKNVVEHSVCRVSPACTSFGNCGGCSFQHTDYRHQLEIKQGYVQELLTPLGIEAAPIIGSPREWGYRNKMEFSFFQKGERIDLGLHAKGQFNAYFGVPPCFICDKDFLLAVEKVLEFANASGLRVYDKRAHEGFFRHLVLRKGVCTGELMVNIVTNRDSVTPDFFAPLIEALKDRVTSLYWTVNSSKSDAVCAEELHLLHGKEAIHEKLSVGGRDFAFIISPFSFFQTNTLGTEKLYSTVLELLRPGSGDSVLDLYCGTGTIGIVIAPHVKEVTGVEQVSSAIANAGINARENGIANIAFAEGTVEKWLVKGAVPAFNGLVVDPPRCGLSNKVIDFIVSSSPEKIVYVSCNPSTLARDLKELSSRGPYRIERAVPVDMFPQTFHVEVVVSLAKTPPL